MVKVWLFRVSCIIFSKKILNRVGYRRQPCRTPADVRKKSPLVSLTITSLLAFLYRFSIIDIRCSSILKCHIIFHSPLCHTRVHRGHTVKRLFEVNTIVTTFFSMFNVFFRHNSKFKICSVILLFFLNPACSSARIISNIGFKKFSIVLNKILLACDIRLTVR